MAPQTQVDPYAASRGFNQMVQLGQQRRDSEAAAEQQALDNQERNRLAQLQGEQFGLQKQRAGMEQQDQQMKGQEWLGTYAARAKASGNIQTARGIMREALQTVAPQKLAEFDAQPDEALMQQIEQFSAFAPPAPGVSGAMYKYVGKDGKPVFGAAQDVRGQTPYQEPQAVPVPSYSPVQTDAGVGAFDSRTGRVTPTGVKAPPKEKPPSEADKKVSVLFSSMLNAEKDIAGLPAGGADTASRTQRVLDVASMSSDEFRKYQSAGLRWAANLLYTKSGATATPDEIQSTWKQFFPQPGDGPEVKAQKAQSRRQELEATAEAYGLDASKIPNAPGAGNGGAQKQAPPQALEYLRQHPEAAQQFQAKYGYLP